MTAQHRIMFSKYLDLNGDGTGYVNGNIDVGTIGAATFDVTGGASEDLWTDAAHGLRVGDKIQFSAVGTGAEPYAISTDYFVVSVPDANTYQLSATKGGSVLEGTGSDSSGTWTVVRQTTELIFTAVEPTRVARMLVSVGDTTGMQAEEYGNLGAALTNGVSVITRTAASGGSTIIDLTDGLPITTNSAWGSLCFDVNLKSWGAGDELLVVRWTFALAGQPLYLDTGQQIVVTLDDDLSGLQTHYFVIQGTT